MIPRSFNFTPARRRKLAVGTGVILMHAGLFAVVALSHVENTSVAPPAPIQVELIRPPRPVVPPPPPPPAPPAARSGGGAPAAPSRIHVPPKPVSTPHEIPAPVVQAPKPALVVGTASTASPTPGMGQGGQGNGSGAGIGDGDGPGSGTGCGMPRLIQHATSADIVREASNAARRARVNGSVFLRCDLRADTRLQNCRILDEHPSGLGLGESAQRVAQRLFRFQPPVRDGRPLTQCQIPLGIEFNLGGQSPLSGPVEG